MKKIKRIELHKRARKNVIGMPDRPRLSVFKSSQHIYAQVIDDSAGKTLVYVSDLKIKNGRKTEKARLVGSNVAKATLALGVKRVVFDRGGFIYHGRVASLAEGAREGGLEF